MDTLSGALKDNAADYTLIVNFNGIASQRIKTLKSFVAGKRFPTVHNFTASGFIQPTVVHLFPIKDFARVPRRRQCLPEYVAVYSF